MSMLDDQLMGLVDMGTGDGARPLPPRKSKQTPPPAMPSVKPPVAAQPAVPSQVPSQVAAQVAAPAHLPPLQPPSGLHQESGGPVAAAVFTPPPPTAMQPVVGSGQSQSPPQFAPPQAQTLPATPPVAAAQPYPAPPAMPPAMPQAQPAAAHPQPPVAVMDDWAETEQLRLRVQQNLDLVDREMGIVILQSEQADYSGSSILEAIHYCRWRPADLIELPLPKLLEFEAALTAHQVYAQSSENFWRARREFLGHEVAKFKVTRRDQFEASTVKAKEHQAVMSDPRVRELYYDFVVARTVAETLVNMGDRFAQLENGIKRAITYRIAEVEHSRTQSKYEG